MHKFLMSQINAVIWLDETGYQEYMRHPKGSGGAINSLADVLGEVFVLFFLVLYEAV